MISDYPHEKNIVSGTFLCENYENIEMDKHQIIKLIQNGEGENKPYLAFSKPFIRVASVTKLMKISRYKELLLKQKLEFDKQVCEPITFKDIDKQKVRSFLRIASIERNYDVNLNISLKEAIERLGLIHETKLLNAAVLLFGKDPQKLFPQVKIRCARFKGRNGTDYIDMKILKGVITELRDSAMKFVLQHIRHSVFFDANRRYDKWEYPLRAVEETLNNALAHRDYFSNAEIYLSVYDDRIEVWNPGELPPPLTPDDLKRKHKSIPRNKLLADKLFLIKYIEQWGRGTNRIVDEMLESKLPEPEFKNYSGGFEVTLFGPGKSFEKEIEKEKFHLLEINVRQKRAIEYAKRTGSISRQEYMRINQVSHTISYQELKDLVSKEIFLKIGAGKYTRYKLTQG